MDYPVCIGIRGDEIPDVVGAGLAGWNSEGLSRLHGDPTQTELNALKITLDYSWDLRGVWLGFCLDPTPLWLDVQFNGWVVPQLLSSGCENVTGDTCFNRFAHILEVIETRLLTVLRVFPKKAEHRHLAALG